MNCNSNSVPRAIIPTLEELALPLEEYLAALWRRNAGDVREWFASYEDFRQRFGGSKNPAAQAAVGH